MSWLTNFVRPKLRALVSRPVAEIPENLWDKCPNCEQMLHHKELSEALYVCRHCDHHMRLSGSKRLESLFDDGQYKEIKITFPKDDPLKFKDLKKYPDRLKAARQNTGLDEGIIVASGTIKKNPLVIAVFDFDFMGGSMSAGVGEGLVEAANAAFKQKCPLLVIPASGGARMQEGILSLMQMPRSVMAIHRLKEIGQPYITLLTNPTYGGVSASFAMLGDISIAESGAMIGFTGARVLKETIRGELPPGFQKAEYLLDHGMLDIVIPRSELREKLATILTLLRPENRQTKAR